MRILADGCFDPFHVGHARYLSEAKRFGDVTVRVAPEAVIRAKHRKPLQSRNERCRMLRAIGFDVTEQPLDDALRETDCFVKGIDWHGRLPDEVLAQCRVYGVHLLFTQTDETHSSERV